jgi:hypothetical protein
MAYPTFTTGDVMDSAAALNNDPSKTVYTYTKQLPFVNIALRELQRVYELNQLPVTSVTSAVISAIPTGTSTTEITFTSSPALPNDLVEPRLLWERQTGIDPYVPMSKVDFLPQQLAGVQIPQFIWYVWQSQKIIVLSASEVNDIKMEYTKFLFSTVSSVTGADNLDVINTQSYLEFKVGALIAQYLAQNPSRAESLEGEAERALQESAGISTKGRQAIAVRHRPFRAGYKRGQNY